jgi:hypothetical protein
MVFCRCECHAAMQLVLGRLAATQSAKPLTLSLLVDQPFFTDLVVPENFGRPGSAAGAAALIYIYYVYICVYDVPIKPPSKNSDPPQVSDFPIKRRPRWMTSQATSWISPCRRSRPSHRPLRQCRDLKYLGSG